MDNIEMTYAKEVRFCIFILFSLHLIHIVTCLFSLIEEVKFIFY